MMEKMGRISSSQKQVALVTGGSGSIGSAICRELAKAGVDVLINYRENDERARTVCDEISRYGIKSVLFKADLTEPEEVKHLYQFVDKEWGHLDILINNAGINKDRSFGKMTLDDWNEVLITDLTALFYCCHQAVRRMKIQNFGRIVNISSVVALTGNFGQTNYCAAKAGIIGFTKALALETAKYNITVNAVCPGFIESRMVDAVPEKVKEGLLTKIPKRRFGTPEEVARLVLFLVREAGDYITGQTFVIDGGWTLG